MRNVPFRIGLKKLVLKFQENEKFTAPVGDVSVHLFFLIAPDDAAGVTQTQRKYSGTQKLLYFQPPNYVWHREAIVH
jgi:hypothetical protein